jgi:hypothetical protein
MNKYNIEGDINFYEEIMKEEEKDKINNETNKCLITGGDLKEYYVTLECKHSFNYDAIYKEITKQKFVYKTYESHYLSSKDYKKAQLYKNKHYIRCPYCRNIQFTCLPFYPHMMYEEKVGINKMEGIKGKENESFFLYGVEFKKGVCNYKYCPKIEKVVANILNDDSTLDNHLHTYCKYHFLNAQILYNKKKKQEEKELQKKLNHEMKQKVQDEKNNQLLLLNEYRKGKGLKELKRLPYIKITKTKNNNEILSANIINIYKPEEEIILCKYILIKGKNKGNNCNCKSEKGKEYCKRHNINSNNIDNDLKL